MCVAGMVALAGLALFQGGDMAFAVCQVGASSQSAARPAVSAAVPDHVEEACRELEVGIAAAADPLAASRACIEAGRCVLVRQCAGPLSARLAGCDETGESLVSSASAGLALLDQAASLLKTVRGDSDEVGELTGQVEMLRAFGEMFAAMGADGSREEVSKRLLSACNLLAPYLDDPDEGIVESAKLWQGAAYRRAGRPDRALQVLRPAVDVPASRRIGVLARLERCRALGDTGSHAAGIALCHRLAARVDAWLTEEDEATRKRASDAVRYVQAALLRDWAMKLRREGQEERASQAEREARRVLGADVWPPGCDRWLLLDESIKGVSKTETPATSQPVAIESSGAGMSYTALAKIVGTRRRQ